jgi:hypothetical protein
MRGHRGKPGRRSGSRPTAPTAGGREKRLFDGIVRVQQHGPRCARSRRAQLISSGFAGRQHGVSGAQCAYPERCPVQSGRTQRGHAADGLLDPGAPRAWDGVRWMEGVQRQIEGSEPMGCRALGGSPCDARPCSQVCAKGHGLLQSVQIGETHLAGCAVHDKVCQVIFREALKMAGAMLV